MSAVEQPPAVAVDEAVLVFVDLEMTGLDPAVERVCEVCLIRCRGRVVEGTLESLVSSERGPGVGQAIHGITAEELAGAPTFADLAPRLLELLDGAVLVAHGVAIDRLFLQAELGRLGLTLPIVGALDTLPLARRCFASRTYRLGQLSKLLNLTHTRAHRAGDDARATMQLFWLEVEALLPASLADLATVRVGEHQARPHILEQVRALVGSTRPVVVRYRSSSRPVEEITYVVTAVRADMDPPVVMGYLHPGRGRKELRADRILAILPLPSAGGS